MQASVVPVSRAMHSGQIEPGWGADGAPIHHTHMPVQQPQAGMPTQTVRFGTVPMQPVYGNGGAGPSMYGQNAIYPSHDAVQAMYDKMRPAQQQQYQQQVPQYQYQQAYMAQMQMAA